MTSRYTEGPVDTVVPLQKIPSTRKATAVFKTSLSQTNLSGIAMGHRVVLDGRTELCCLRPPFGVSLDPENQCPGGIGERVNLRRGWFGLRAGGFVSTRNVTGYAVNEKLVLHPDHQAHGGWRGPLAVQRTHKGEPSTLFAMASRVIERAVSHGHAALVRSDVDDSAWMKSAISSLLGVDDPLQQAKAVIELAACCQRVLAQQPSVARVAAPVKIFGDIHGQLLDVLLLFATYGSPTHSGGDVQTTSYIFNGDFVDRGAHQLEVVVLLFSLKIMYPDQIFLLRGNHEFRSQNLAMRESGFFHHLARRMPLATAKLVFEQVHACFDWLPLAAIAGGIVLVIHGGIGDGSWTPEDLENEQRPIRDVNHSTAVLQAMWSDPSGSDADMKSGVHMSHRGEDIPEFGPDVSEKYCRDNKLGMIIRSHQYIKEGYKVMHSGWLLCVFSARNYFWDKQSHLSNDCAMLLLAQDRNGHLRVHAKRLAAVPPGGRFHLWVPIAAAAMAATLATAVGRYARARAGA